MGFDGMYSILPCVRLCFILMTVLATGLSNSFPLKMFFNGVLVYAFSPTIYGETLMDLVVQVFIMQFIEDINHLDDGNREFTHF